MTIDGLGAIATERETHHLTAVSVEGQARPSGPSAAARRGMDYIDGQYGLCRMAALQTSASRSSDGQNGHLVSVQRESKNAWNQLTWAVCAFAEDHAGIVRG